MGKKKEKILHYYYGIPHAHTGYSTGRGTPLTAYEYAKDNGIDFLIITDHNSYLSKDISTNNKTCTKWTSTISMKDKFRKKSDSFIPLVGFETKTSPYGDFNIINPTTFFTGVVKDLRLLILWMLNNSNSIVTINHPHKEIALLDYNELLNKLITSVEVGNGSFPNKYIRHDHYYYSLLDKGWKLGAINGQDNHRMNFGDSENLTVVMAESLSAIEIINAFKERRTYSTESKSLKMNFTINDNFMGSIIHKEKILQFMIFAEDNNCKINCIEIITNKGTIVKKISGLNLNSIKYMYNHELDSKETWFLIRLFQENKRMAISSPIFII